MKSDKINYGSLCDDSEKGYSQEAYLKNLHDEYEFKLRINFIRKVYGIVLTQLLITALFCIAAITFKEVANFQKNNPSLLLIACVMSFIVALILTCFTKTARVVPINYILLFLFTLCEAYITAKICVDVDQPQLVLMAATMTCAIVFGLTVYACVTDTDFTTLGGILFCCCVGIILLSIFGLFTSNKFLHVLISALSVILFSIYLIYDTQRLLGRHSYSIGYDDYIIGALMIYLDIIIIFIEILKLLKS